jgi:NAD(P)-dependent dehydrogenase (short-subunit alcohol dehydrogenase family)
MDLHLKGKRAFVSGASSGIGRAIAIELAQEGCDVAVHGRDKARTEETVKVIQKLGATAFPVYGELATDEGCEAVSAATLERMKAVDIVVNNVGLMICKDDPPWHEVPVQTWIDSYQVNFLSTLRMSQRFLPGIIENGWGRFINVSTGAATHSPSSTEYGSAKAALNKLTADMAKNVGQYGATCNGIAPGVTHAASVVEYLGGIAKREGWPGGYAEWEQMHIAKTLPQQSIKSFARAEDVAGLAAYLASPRAGHLTGMTIRVDSGHSHSVL